MTTPFATAWVRTVRFGVVAAVHLPSGLEPVPTAVLARLHEKEAALAQEERGRRQIEVAGGRLAYRVAAEAMGLEVTGSPLLVDSARAPVCPPGLTVSITHKEDLVLAFVGRSDAGCVGIDLEGGPRDRSAIMTRVCRPEELAEVERLPQEERWPAVMVRFAVKEALYKAVAPQLGRFFGFQAARVTVTSRDEVAATLLLDDAPPFELESEVLWLEDGRLVAFVRAREQ